MSTATATASMTTTVAKPSSGSFDYSWIGKLLGAGGSLYGGYSAMTSANANALLLEEQGMLTQSDYERQAALTRDDGHRARAKQAMEYVNSGIEIVGTPQLVMAETLSRSIAKATSLQVTGRNYNRLYGKKAAISRNEGQSAMISSILNAGATLLK